MLRRVLTAVAGRSHPSTAAAVRAAHSISASASAVAARAQAVRSVSTAAGAVDWRAVHNRRAVTGAPPNYLKPNLPDALRVHSMPVVRATADTLKGYGSLFANKEECKVRITRWPAQGWRPVDTDTGDEAGVTTGVFESAWKGDVLYGRNAAVGGNYILAYAHANTAKADTTHTRAPKQMLLWHANYHPDGGQFFYPLEKKPFLVPLALPGDDITPDKFVTFWFDGSAGLYIHANIWHEGVFTTVGTQRFHDVQGAVHARVSCDFAREFGCLLSADLTTSPLTALPPTK